MTSWRPGHIREVRYKLSECDGAINRARYWLNVGNWRKAQDAIMEATTYKHEAMRGFPYAEPEEPVTFEHLYMILSPKDLMMQMAQAIIGFMEGGAPPDPNFLTMPEIIARLQDIIQRTEEFTAYEFDPACLVHLNAYIAELRNIKQYLQQANPLTSSGLATIAAEMVKHEMNFITCVYGKEVQAYACYTCFSGMDYWLMHAYLTIRNRWFNENDKYQVLLMLGTAESLKHSMLRDYIPRMTEGTDPYPPHDSGEDDLPPTPPDYASAGRKRTKARTKKRS